MSGDFRIALIAHLFYVKSQQNVKLLSIRDWNLNSCDCSGSTYNICLTLDFEQFLPGFDCDCEGKASSM